MSKYAVVLTTFWLVALTVVAEAKVIINERTKYYTVSGKTGEQIYKQLLRKGPRIKGSKAHYIATATIGFEIRNIDGYEWGNQCVIRELDVVIDVVYRIPKWKRPKKVSRELGAAWDAFLAHIWRHERKHTAIAKDTAYELWRAVKGVKGDRRKKCKNMLTPAEKRAEKVYARYHKRQERFDASAFGDGGQQFRYDARLRRAK